MTEPVDPKPYRISLEQKDELRRLNRELIEFLEQPRPEPGAPEANRWASDLSQQLVALHAKISAHFTAEDEAGLLGKLGERYPRAARKLDLLTEEHTEICDDLQAIVAASMTYSMAKTPPNPRLREWTRSLLESFARHESEETALIQELIFTDVGTGD